MFVGREVGAIHYGEDGFEAIAFDFGPTAHLEVLFGAVLQNRLIVEVGAHQLLPPDGCQETCGRGRPRACLRMIVDRSQWDERGTALPRSQA